MRLQGATAERGKTMGYYDQPEVYETEVEFECENCNKTVEAIAYTTWGDDSAEVECPECNQETTHNFPQYCSCGDHCRC